MPVFLGGKKSTQDRKASPAVKKPKPKRVPVTFRMSKGVKEALFEAVVTRDKYGLKGKSRWIGEAITDFLQEKSWKDQVLDVDMLKGKEEKDVVYLDESLKDDLDEARSHVMQYLQVMVDQGIRQENLDNLKITLSSIIRAAIIWRLFDLRMPMIKPLEETT